MSSSVDQILIAALNGLSQRQRVASDNIANVDTPGFKASQVRFEGHLQEAIRTRASQGDVQLRRTSGGHLDERGATGGANLDPEVITDRTRSLRQDRNNVDIDQQMLTLSEAALSYSALAQVATSRLALMKSIAHDGRR